MKRLLPRSLTGRLMVALVGVIVLINLTSLFFYYLFRDQAAMLGAAGQAAEEVIAVTHLLETIPHVDPDEPADTEEGLLAQEEERRLHLLLQRESMVRRLSTPARIITVDNQPLVETSDSGVASRLVLSRLQSGVPGSREIRVDSLLDPGGEGLDHDDRPPGPRQGVFRRDDPANRGYGEGRRGDRSPGERSGDDRGPGDRSSADRPDGPSNPQMQTQRFWLRQLFKARNADRFRFIPGMQEALFRVSVKGADNVWINWRIRLAVDEPRNILPQLLWLTVISVLISAIAFVAVRLATQPLDVFASAAERLGLDVNAEPMSEKGPSEVRRASLAFNTMQMRVKRFISDRTQMLAAISHDLRTPITRLRLRAEFVDDDQQRDKMLHDLNEMETMIAATLTFARDDAANEPATNVDAAAIIAALCSDHADAGRPVTYSGPDTFDLLARPLALKRAIDNFVDNAVKYGKSAHVEMVPGFGELAVYIDDEGPGIPLHERERVFAPFTRLETSRSRETGGTGLGMTIARNAIRSMGGDVELINLPQGGLRVKVTLPVPETEMRTTTPTSTRSDLSRAAE